MCGDWRKLKRLARYLLDKTRFVLYYSYQLAETASNRPGMTGSHDSTRIARHGDITTWVDTDYAGCRVTRRSTSGGCVLLGTHLIKGWSTTQSKIALSSGEAEYYGIVKGASQSIGIREIMVDLGITKQIVIKTDASAAKGIANRAGLGKLRHLETNLLWIQERVATGELLVNKVAGTTNIADTLTKHVDGNDLNQHISWVHASVLSGRHDIMPNLANDMAVSELHYDMVNLRNHYDTHKLGCYNCMTVTALESQWRRHCAGVFPGSAIGITLRIDRSDTIVAVRETCV
jgi:hypothetical protein